MKNTFIWLSFSFFWSIMLSLFFNALLVISWTILFGWPFNLISLSRWLLENIRSTFHFHNVKGSVFVSWAAWMFLRYMIYVTFLNVQWHVSTSRELDTQFSKISMVNFKFLLKLLKLFRIRSKSFFLMTNKVSSTYFTTLCRLCQCHFL